ncbi:carbohydrate kinase family protein [Sunxiuqinia sp. A32]|uniref:carbohydrate kinase family protein n=1 Tax=Sunxiuqinia sp. A32 TaxID=3461496 RepID=UPI004045DADB
MNKESFVIGIGELLWDVFPDQKKMGGATANFAYHVEKLGVKSFMISTVGHDELGDELIEVLDRAKLTYDVQRHELPTGTVQVTLSGNGIPNYEICEPVAWDFITMKPEWEDIAKNASVVCFGSLAQRGEVSRKTIRQFLQLVPDSAYKVFDINLRQQFYSRELIADSLKLCNFLKINDEELEMVAEMFGLDGSTDEKCLKLIADFNLKLLALTCGTDGSHLFTDKQHSFKETPIVEVVDTVGAGDSFTAAIVAGLLTGKTLEKTHEMAVKLSAFVCTQSGAMPDYDKVQFVN